MKTICAIVAFAAMTTAMFAQDIPLKDPPAKIGMDLFDAIKARAAARDFVKKDVPIADLSTILWAGNGMKGADAVSGASKAGRTIPYSGDNVYMNVYVLTSKGAYLYEPEAKSPEAGIQDGLARANNAGEHRHGVTDATVHV